jgi:fumarate reductase flavoprotein subunit
VEQLESLLLRSRDIGLSRQSRGANPELVAAYRVKKMLKLALCVASGAQARTESRGAHYRRDFPRRDDAQWLKRTLARWAHPDATRPELGYEALDITTMELPPGWRGYGDRDHIPHPASAGREAEVGTITADPALADRFARQHALMPFEQLLPERYRGRNQRLEEASND